MSGFEEVSSRRKKDRNVLYGRGVDKSAMVFDLILSEDSACREIVSGGIDHVR